MSDASALAAQLRASEARWRAIFDSAVDGIILIDGGGLIEAYNAGAVRLFGYAEDEVLGRNVTMLMPSPYREEHDGYIERYLASGQARIIGIGREVTGQRKDGTTFPVHLSVGEITIGGQRKFTGILHDLTRRVRMENQLREQESLARLGEMAGLIAHEVKNPLAGIRGAIQVVGSRMPAEVPDASILKEIINRIDALDQMMRELLLFARPPSPTRAPIDVAGLVRSTAGLLQQDPLLRHVRIEVVGGAPPISGDPDMLKIVFQNLFINSAQAMQGAGSIQVAVASKGEHCEILVADRGPGIPHEVRERVFAPFFTTKSRGTGLGLPTARRLVEVHRGSIEIDCPAGGGTTVTIQLPFHAS
ncbi:MAG: PAS domain S-box protein [Acidobacteria bacterium]|nr:PAS domain S-box protein [Acidobacteriota bacterium]